MRRIAALSALLIGIAAIPRAQAPIPANEKLESIEEASAAMTATTCRVCTISARC
jgi:hypothetical protein